MRRVLPCAALICSLLTVSFGSKIELFEDFYTNFNGDKWINRDGWFESSEPCDGTWFGISCTRTSLNVELISIRLPNNNLVGIFPSSISQMILKDLDVSSNRIQGSLPQYFYSRIETLALEKNEISGEIPPSYANLRDLKIFDVSTNSLTGQIPDILGEWRNVLQIDLSTNLFFGQIPSLMISNSSLQYLSLSSNMLSGVIPDSLCQNTGMIELDLSINQLSGSLPSCLGNLMEINTLRIYSNKISGTIPLGIYQLRKLITLELSDNLITGTLSSDISNLTNLASLNLQDNQLSGNLPEITTSLWKLKVLTLSNNSFVGNLPNSMSNLVGLQLLYLDRNQLSGTIGSIFNNCLNMTVLVLSRNSFHGDISSSFSNLIKLQKFDISNNNFSGIFPGAFYSFPALNSLVISHNNFSGEVSGFTSLSSLTHMDLSFNSFSGELESAVYFLVLVEYLFLNNNKFYGTIPSDIGSLIRLKNLNLANNELSGRLPSSIRDLDSLLEIDITGNKIVSLPDSLAELESLQTLRAGHNLISVSLEKLIGMKSLTVLELGNNNIVGTIPESMSTFILLNVLDLSNNQLSGEIPEGLIRLHSLKEVRLNGNSLTGKVGAIRSDPIILDLSGNMLSGDMSFLSDLTSLQFINISGNQFGGELPPLNGQKSLIVIDYSENNLSGTPPAFASLDLLTYLDLSGNNFSGSVPKIHGDEVLSYLDLSENRFDDASTLETLAPLASCKMQTNIFECPLSVTASVLCGAICTTSDDRSSASFIMKIEGNLDDFDRSTFLNSLSSITNTSLSRFHIDSVTQGSVVMQLTISPPNSAQLKEGTAARVVYRIKNTHPDVLKDAGISIISFSDVPPKSVTNVALIAIVTVFVLLVLSCAGAIIALIVILRMRKKKGRKGQEMVVLDNVQVESIIGSGQFGQVFKGNWNGTVIALKGIKNQIEDEKKWREEISLLQKLNHPNIVRFLGVHKMNENVYMVLEFAENGSLDTFLMKPSTSSGLSSNDLLKMVFDIANGMMYLQSKKVIHRDLAARNLLLDGSLHVKISDFGLSKSDMTSIAEYFDCLPMKWCAPEVIQQNKSSSSSDVWSFGVVVWEIFSYAITPYRGMSNKEVLPFILEGKRLSKPNRCPDEVYSLMLRCWSIQPQERPSFDEIRNHLFNAFPALFQNAEIQLQRKTEVESDENISINIGASDEEYEEIKYEPSSEEESV